MDVLPSPAAEACPVAGLRKRLLWWLACVVLLGWQGWMTLSLFGRDEPWRRLLDDRPVVSGQHPLHLYHGYLGARALPDHGSLSCYDPAFQAGYPKTPIFDSASRPAELFLLLGGGEFQPAAYKIGLAVCCVLAAPLLLLAGRALGMHPVAAWLAAALGLLVWWGEPGRDYLEEGRLHLLIASLAAVVQVTLLVRFDRAPGLVSWLGVLVSGYVGWFAQPAFFALLLPLGMLYYLTVGHRHGLAWHVALVGGMAGAVAANFLWLRDWVEYWWIQAPLQAQTAALPPLGWKAVWQAPLWGTPADRAVALLIVAAALVGGWRFNQCRQRPAARLLGLGGGGFLLLALGGTVLKPLGDLGATQLFVPALLFGALPAAHGLVEASRLVKLCGGGVVRRTLVGLAGLLVVAGLARETVLAVIDRCAGTTPLTVGLDEDRQAVVQTLQTHTTAAARILWEDLTPERGADAKPGQGWTPLLPVLTGRTFLGGLDPQAGIEHAYAGLVDQMLAGRPLRDWTDAELDEFARAYNLGWVVCWSAPARQRFDRWPKAKAIAKLCDHGAGVLYELDRPRSYALKGRVGAMLADSRRICLDDVEPENGEVVLSLHHQEGLQASPGRIRVERDLDPYDPIPFIRLRVPGPMARLTLTWQGR